VREALRKALEGRGKLDSERRILQQAAGQVRESLRSIARNKGGSVEALRKKLTAKLADFEGRLGETSNQLVELDLKANELRVRFDEMVREIKLAEPLPLA
jgi:uncharacterized protein involved in exopolysaccharide biosynthesis